MDRLSLLNEHWLTFRQHHPVGAYFPIGQVDGDCRICKTAWPCNTIRDVLETVLLSEHENTERT